MMDLVLTAKAFADPSRVRILMALGEGELCVCELCDALSLTQSTLSTHLKVVRDAGLASARKRGKWMYYAVAPKARPLVRSMFKSFAPKLKADASLRRDAERLSQRLALRDKGACCVGFGRKAPSCNPGK